MGPQESTLKVAAPTLLHTAERVRTLATVYQLVQVRRTCHFLYAKGFPQEDPRKHGGEHGGGEVDDGGVLEGQLRDGEEKARHGHEAYARSAQQDASAIQASAHNAIKKS